MLELSQGTRAQVWRRTHSLVLTVALALGACGKGGTSGPAPVPETAEVSLTFAQAPPGVACVSITVASDRTDRRRFPIVPGLPAVFPLPGLRPGVNVFSVDAYPDDCKDLVAAKVAPVPTWDGGPLSVTLKAGINDLVQIVLQKSAQTAVVLGFDPTPTPTCAAGAAACTSNKDCCSQRCTADPNRPDLPGLCRADEPATPSGGILTYQPDELGKCGAHASYPAFDGDNFFVSFPRAPTDANNRDASADEIRTRYVEPALRATGFTAWTSLTTPPARPVSLGGGNYARLTQRLCRREADNSVNSRLCRVLSGRVGEPVNDNGAPIPRPPFAPTDAWAAFFVRDTLGIPITRLAANTNRRLNYWLFPQRERNVPIEHKGAVAIQHGSDRRVSTVFGSVLSRYRIVNEVALNPAAAMERAFVALARLEGVTGSKPRNDATLVLLPYGAATPDPRGGAPAALRFAYRVGVVGSRLLGPAGAVVALPSEPAAFTIWIDAATGDLLKYAAESGEAAGDAHSVSYQPAWCRDPSQGGSCGLTVDLVESTTGINVGTQPTFGLSLPGGAAYYSAAVPGDALTLAFDTAGVCRDESFYRGLNAFSVLEQARTTLEDGGNFLAFLNPISVFVDLVGDQNRANFPLNQLKFAAGGTRDPLQCTNGAKRVLSGAQDATILTHEYAHLVTMQLQTANPVNNCGAGGCPVLNPYNRAFFHDYSDGYAAMLAESPCIGGWSSKNVPVPAIDDPSLPFADHVAHACANASETSKLPRLVFADDNPASAFVSDKFVRKSTTPIAKDRFPEHRELSTGDYGDGQILGAAMWHMYQGMNSAARLPGTLSVWGHMNQAIWSTGFSPTTCPDSTACDTDIYRAGQELLRHLADAWIASGASQTLNKVQSAFARAGFFLAPPSCLTGARGDMTAPLDPQFCAADGKNGADAVVDIDDGDTTPDDRTDRFGVALTDEDFVKADGPPPTFRVWTGAPFALGAPGAEIGDGEASKTTTMCNAHFRVFVRLASPTATDADWQPATPVLDAKDCYATAALDATLWTTLVPATTVYSKVEYKVVTWNDPGMSTLRDSTQPGAGLWNTTNDIAPSAFFATSTGRPPI